MYFGIEFSNVAKKSWPSPYIPRLKNLVLRPRTMWIPMEKLPWLQNSFIFYKQAKLIPFIHFYLCQAKVLVIVFFSTLSATKALTSKYMIKKIDLVNQKSFSIWQLVHVPKDKAISNSPGGIARQWKTWVILSPVESLLFSSLPLQPAASASAPSPLSSWHCSALAPEPWSLPHP